LIRFEEAFTSPSDLAFASRLVGVFVFSSLLDCGRGDAKEFAKRGGWECDERTDFIVGKGHQGFEVHVSFYPMAACQGIIRRIIY